MPDEKQQDIVSPEPQVKAEPGQPGMPEKEKSKEPAPAKEKQD